MKHLKDTILTVVVTFLLSMFLTSVIELISQEKGRVSVGPRLELAGRLYVPIEISNFSAEPINELVLTVPVRTNIAEISVSDPLQIYQSSDFITGDQKKNLKVSSIAPNQVTKMMMPVATTEESDLVRVVNAKSLKLIFVPIKDIRQPLAEVFERALISSLLTAILLGFVYSWLAQKLEKSEQMLSEARKDSDEIRAKIDALSAEADKKMRETREATARIRILLLARLSDYSKELSFWRDAIRRILIQATGRKVSADSLLKQVTQTLNTHSTLARSASDFDAITVMAGLLSKAPEKNH